MLGLFKISKSVSESGFLRGAVDSHSHILYGVDDGVKTEEESLQILSYMEEAGVETLWLTPHIMEDVPNTSEGLRIRFAQLKSAYKGGVNLSLAAEYMLDNLFMERLRSRDILCHCGNNVLVEASASAPPVDFWNMLTEIFDYGYIPILAHPERYLYLRPQDYERLGKMGVHLQLNMFSLTGIYGPQVGMRARYLLGRDVYSLWGSDCHRYSVLQKQYSLKALKKDELRRLEALKFGLKGR